MARSPPAPGYRRHPPWTQLNRAEHGNPVGDGATRHDTYFTAARALDIDHLVPLAEAWDSGVSAWTAKEREAYANDLGDDRALIAVSASSNRSKADQDPTAWQPPAADYRCTYTTDWVAMKTRWPFAIDDAELTALTDVLGRCPNTSIAAIRAR